MALVSRIVDVNYEQTINNEDGTTSTVDLSLSGRYVVDVVYYDDAQPDNILLSHSFEFPQDTTESNAQAAISEFGQKVRTARTRVASLKKFIGTVIPI